MRLTYSSTHLLVYKQDCLVCCCPRNGANAGIWRICYMLSSGNIRFCERATACTYYDLINISEMILNGLRNGAIPFVTITEDNNA